jgi:dipeptidyl aminopeptidase/acylaminoacyl peptidase
VKCPVFVIHGRDDVEVPFEHGSRIHDAGRFACVSVCVSV